MSKDLIYTKNTCYVRPEYGKSYLNYFEINKQDVKEKEFDYVDKYERYLNSRFIDVLKENGTDSKIISEYDNLVKSYINYINENKDSLVDFSEESDSEFDLSAYYDVFNKLNLGYNDYINLLSDEEELNSDLDATENISGLFDFINFVKLNPKKFDSGYKVDNSLCSDLKSFGRKELDINDKLIYGDLLRFESNIEPELNNLENEKLQEELMREMSE